MYAYFAYVYNECKHTQTTNTLTVSECVRVCVCVRAHVARNENSAHTVAAMPVAKQAAPLPPSSSAIFCSSACTVGLVVREYENPFARYSSMDA